MRFENEEQREYSFTDCCASIERLIAKGLGSRGMFETYSQAIGIIAMHQHYDPERAEKILSYVKSVCKGQSSKTEDLGTQAGEDSLLTQTATAVGKVIGMLQVTHQRIFRLETDRFDVRDLTSEEFRELKSACANHLAHLISGIEKEPIE